MKKQNLIIFGAIVIGVVLIWFAYGSKTDTITPANTSTESSAMETKETVDVRAGIQFPEFTLTEVDGEKLTLTSINEKPTIVWFTTTWCVPCQIGAKKVAKLDDELGGDAFDVLVVFVDPREDESALRQWKNDFANADWKIAFDNISEAIAEKINLKFLDSKYLLDTNGIVKNVDFKTANDRYLDIIRSNVTGV